MNEQKRLIYELFDKQSGKTVKYFQSSEDVWDYMTYCVGDNNQYEIYAHHPMPDTHITPEADRIRKRRNTLIDSLLDG